MSLGSIRNLSIWHLAWSLGATQMHYWYIYILVPLLVFVADSIGRYQFIRSLSKVNEYDLQSCLGAGCYTVYSLA
jgi:hypothetical protein